ncbi:MAG: hypothetical protein ACXWPM_09875 [Bdellovibrionota bacterium]
MRRMRDFFVHFGMFAIPTICAALLIHWGIKKFYLSGNTTSTIATKSAPAKTDGGPQRSVASANQPQTAAKTEHSTFGSFFGIKKEPATDPAIKVEPPMAATPLDPSRPCVAVETAGGGPTQMTISDAEWELVLAQFRQTKTTLGAWLKDHQKELDEKAYAFMEKQLDAVKLPRPPTNGEPDLTFRGIAVFGRDESDEPSVQLGGGFVKLVKSDPKRAGFELARVVAQAWAPCELQKAKVFMPWGGLTSCLSVKETNECTEGSYSEGGWAVSTTIAAKVMPPGCRIPAFVTKQAADCLQTIPLPLTATTHEIPRPLWKESTR